jgi:hypothetical protein
MDLTREDLRHLAAGRFYYQNRGQSVDYDRIETYVDGFVSGYDFGPKTAQVKINGEGKTVKVPDLKDSAR